MRTSEPYYAVHALFVRDAIGPTFAAHVLGDHWYDECQATGGLAVAE